MNRLLAMLPPAVLQRLDGAASLLTVGPGDVMLDAGEPVVDVYFPLDLVVSLDQTISHDVDSYAAGPGVALVGPEGVIGLEALLGNENSINRATVRIGGRAWRLPAAAVREEFGRAGVMHRLLLASADGLLGQSCAIGACERVHSVRQRVMRWLLMFADRAPSDDIRLTHDALSQLLGTRRASITVAASQLQTDGLIAYQRGIITLRDRNRLEAGACKCYHEIKARYTFQFDGEY
ncbi:MAG: Crp/Fnr family transcriptional regulator [Pseudomonadota bacterium]|nr:Crp/Fnr family transcriptional regulator [Pseudomonadota bacterium]